MADDPRVRQLLEEALDSGLGPEEVCRAAGAVELLPQVRRRWQRLGLLQAQLDTIFPQPGPGSPAGQAPGELPGQQQRCRHLLALEGRLAGIVRGTDRPAAGECLEAAELCFVNKHCAAARLYAEALAATPRLTEDLRAGHRFNAARAAALAGCGRGDDVAGLTEPEQEDLRKQAREWLQLDLAAWGRRLDTGTAADRIQAQKTLSQWREDPDLAGLRDPVALDGLPPAERQECRALWSDLEARLRSSPPPK